MKGNIATMKKDKEKNVTQPEQEQPEVAEETVTEAEETQAEEQKEASIDEWREALELAVKQRDDYLDSLRRAQADFQNFKRRNATSRADGYSEGVCDSIEAMLPVIDNLERALAAANPEDPLASGVQMTLKMMLDSLAKFGFAEVPALGEDFDPEKHNAVMREQSDEPDKVLEVFQKGYRVKDKIIRYAMVKVSVD
jgi:molecular chaperone GrpE